jgi:hypothetical protein
VLQIVFARQCSAPHCKRKASHSLPAGSRKLNLLKFRVECLARYNAAEKPSDQDFQ